jgi:hypothetical protein
MQQIGNGALGPQAANAIRVVAAQNGVWSLGNFGGLPPQTTSNNTIKQDVSIKFDGKFVVVFFVPSYLYLI